MTFLGVPARRLSLRAHFGPDRHVDALASLYFALFKGDPFSVGVEPDATGNYGRATVPNDVALWGSVIAGATSITTQADIVWPTATAAWSIADPLTHWGIFDAPALGAGTLWYGDKIGSGGFVVSASGNQPRILAGGITILQGG